MKLAAGRQRNWTAAEISSGTPVRPTGGTMSGSGAAPALFARSPPMRPGETQFTVMLFFAYSAASARVNPSSPALPAETCARPT